MDETDTSAVLAAMERERDPLYYDPKHWFCYEFPYLKDESKKEYSVRPLPPARK
jgi:hypothetical protein